VRVGTVQVVADQLAHPLVDVQDAQLIGGDPASPICFIVDRRYALDRTSDIRVLVLLADLSVAVGNDVVRVGVDAEETGDLREDASLLSAHSAAVSPMSWAPPGRAHWPVSRWRWSRISPASLTTRRLLAGMRVLALGAYFAGAPSLAEREG
jgi:hypothetical protein